MGLVAWPFKVRDRDALTASVAEVPHDRGRLMPHRSRDAGWQLEAWLMFHMLGEVRFCARYMGNTLSRVRFFVGTRDHPGDPVIPIPDDTKTKEDLQVRDVLERIKGRDGTFASLVRVYGIHAFVAGESHLVGETGLDAETWEFLSTSEIRRISKNNQAVMPEGGPEYEKDRKGNNEWSAIGPESLVLRFWTRDPEFRERADAPMRAVLDICQALHTAQAMQTAGDLARLATAGLYFVPAEAELPQSPVTEARGGPAQPARLQLMDQLHAAMQTAMEDPSSVAAISPILVEVKAAYIEMFKRQTFEREVDKTIVQRIDHLIRRFAQGVDLPPEKLLGIGDINHWSAWNVSEETISAHISPMAAAFCEDLTVGFLRPTLEAMTTKGGDGTKITKGLDLDRYAIGFDVTDLIVSPDRAQHAITLYDKFELGGDHLLEALGFDPSVRPDIEEIIRRIMITRATNPRNPDPGPDIAALQGKAPAPTGAERSVPSEPGAPLNPQVAEPAVTDKGRAAEASPATGEAPAKNGKSNAKATPRAQTKGADKTPAAKKGPPAAKTAKATTIDRMVTAIDVAVDQAIETGTTLTITSPERWRPLRDALATHGYLDGELADKLIDGVILLATNKRLNPGMDVLGAATILCEAALFDPDDLLTDNDETVPV